MNLPPLPYLGPGVEIDGVRYFTTFEVLTFARQAQREAVAAAVPEWLPIETAPKDGTFILLWEQYSTAPFVGSWVHQGWSVSHEHVDAEGGWDGANVVDALSLPITHWLPLPPPPEVKP